MSEFIIVSLGGAFLFMLIIVGVLEGLSLMVRLIQGAPWFD